MSEETKQLYREKTDLFNKEKFVQFYIGNDISKGLELLKDHKEHSMSKEKSFSKDNTKDSTLCQFENSSK